ncbi:metallophosphoesterase family protein [Paenibacillus sp. RC67]|uniref:metallophosphoesterase family protein n=1 Tax=Paenibacillus sp. RC67 TaxID=3039392 RepID=UPI0024AD0C9F|nr:metallophosphoesterase family protein [Paenibacillus sp. RC67]
MAASIAIVTDIHGNSAALRAVLEDMDKEFQIDHIYCIGDMVGIGHETNEVLELLFTRNDISFVIGNHEEAFLNIIHGEAAGTSSEERRHHQWLVSRMDKSYILKLMELPKSLTVEIEGKQLLLLHYHLTHDNTFLPIDSEPSGEKLEKLYPNTPANVICFGHHHPVHFFETNNRLFLNPGSLGCNHKPLARYAVLHIAEKVEAELREVPYDNQAFLLQYELLGVPDKDFILKVFHGNQHLNF